MSIQTPSQPPPVPSPVHRATFLALPGWKSQNHWKRWCVIAIIGAISLFVPLGWSLKTRGVDLEDNSVITDVGDQILDAV